MLFRSDACDTAQEIFIRAMNGIKEFRFEAAFSTWLSRIAVNMCKNRLKSLEFRLRRLKIRLAGNPGNPSDGIDVPDSNPTPSEKLEKAEHRELVRKAIEKLSPGQKEAVVLRDLEGFSYEEIAAVTGMRIGTVKSRLARGRQTLLEIFRSMPGYGMSKS